MAVELCEVSRAPYPITEPFNLIVIGGPTHPFSMTRESPRADTLERGATEGLVTVGIREWLAHLDSGPHSDLVATFDTRVERVRRLPGSVAKTAGKALHKLGYQATAQAESFYVIDADGPLASGELDRAQAWGERLGIDVAARALGRHHDRTATVDTP